MTNGWSVTLNGSTVCGADCPGDTVDACLLQPPDGLGVPDLRTEDQTYPQRDGVEHFADWYSPRLITLTGLVGGTGCGCLGGARANARALMSAWSRECDDTEAVIRTPCGPTTGGSELLPNPSMTTDASNWNANGTDGTIARSTSQFRSTPASLALTATVTPAVPGLDSDPVAVEAGQWYGAHAYSRAGITPREFTLFLLFQDSSGHAVGGAQSASILNTSTDWSAEYVIAPTPAPDGAAFASLGVVSTLGDLNSGEVNYFDDFSVIQTGSPVNGPFGVRGRPRVAPVAWRQGQSQIADTTLRFDSPDQRLFILDADGTPGSGAVCASITKAPVHPNYFTAALLASVDHHWPLDFPNLSTATVSGVTESEAADTHGSANNQPGWAGIATQVGPMLQTTPILYTLSMSAIAGISTFQAKEYPASYTSGMIGWWMQTNDNDQALPGAVFSVDSLNFGRSSNFAPSITFGGTTVAMNSAVQDALGYTDALRGQPVFVMLAWTNTALWVFVANQGQSAPFLAQTVTGTGKPAAGTASQIVVLNGKISNVISGANHYATSSAAETFADTLVTAGFGDDSSALVLPAAGDLCVPFTATFDTASGEWDTLYIFRDDGTYVGFQPSTGTVTDPSSLDTETGTGKEFFDTTDATLNITGDPFMTVAPGETVHIFGGGDATICYRPAVLSA